MSSDTSTEDQATENPPGESDTQDRSSAGLPDADEVSEQEKEEIEAERQERLDPENRPDNAEVDNTDRDFDTTKGQFTDSEDHGLGPFADPE
jgi:hypothetical protein